ncbi:MAG: L,D-transpeptidase [Anaerolineales bacterium]
MLHTPVVLGPTHPGDYRVYRTRATDDMPGIPGVPYSNYFSGGFSIHGAPWWNWRETARGLLEDALMGEARAYQQAEAQCSAPPHRLVPDRWRLPPSE